MCRAVILVLNFVLSKCYMLVQYNITKYLIVTTGLSQWHYGHAIIIKMFWDSISLTDQVLNDQPTTI